MPRFHYTARDADGATVSGEIEAASQQQAEDELQARGLQVQSLQPVETEADLADIDLSNQSAGEGQWLSDADFGDATAGLAGLTKAGLPLITGMRALSEEIPSRRMSRVLAQVSRRLEAGEALETALQQHRNQVPAHLQGLIQAGVRTGQLAAVLEQYLSHVRRAVDLKRRTQFSLVYPLILLLFLFVGFVFVVTTIIPQFVQIFEDFGTELPVITVLLITGTDLILDWGIWIALGVVVAGIGLWMTLGLIVGAACRRRLTYMVPIVGPLLHMLPLSQFCNILALLVENQTKLPDALRMAGSAVRDPNIQEGCRLLAEDVEGGMMLGEAAAVRPHFPATLVQIFNWERRRGVFPDALRAAGEVYDNSVRAQAGLLSVACEPIFLVKIAVGVGGTVVALFMPLIKLLNDLS